MNAKPTAPHFTGRTDLLRQRRIVGDEAQAAINVGYYDHDAVDRFVALERALWEGQ